MTAKTGEQTAIAAILKIAKDVHEKIKKRKAPTLEMPLRALSNVTYDPKKGYFELVGKSKERTLAASTVKTFAQTLLLMNESKNVIQTDDIMTKREVYYVSKNWGDAKFNEQPESDAVMDDVEGMLRVQREQLGFIPEEDGGAVAGELTIIDKDPETNKDIRVDCTKFATGAYNIPNQVEDLRFETKATFVLAIETAGMFQRLVKHKYWKTANCILISMKGVPSRATRRFIRKLADEQKLPVYVFTDGDPYGYLNIYRTLKVGSGNAAHINKFFCVPTAKFIGVTPQDILDYNLPTHTLKDIDVKRINDGFKNDPFVQHYKEWQKALKQMVALKKRVEQQAFATHGLNYVIEKYLPVKIKDDKTWLP